MNNLIADKIADEIECLPFVDRIGGLVHTKEIKENGTLKRFPFYNGESYTPEDKYRSVIYFEQRKPETVVKHETYSYHMESELLLVGWLNDKKLGDESLKKFKAVLPIVETLRSLSPQSVAPVHNLTFEFKGEAVADRTLFSKYTYNHFREYVNDPYTVFGIIIKCNWTIAQDCIDDFCLKPELC